MEKIFIKFVINLRTSVTWRRVRNSNHTATRAKQNFVLGTD